MAVLGNCLSPLALEVGLFNPVEDIASSLSCSDFHTLMLGGSIEVILLVAQNSITRYSTVRSYFQAWACRSCPV